MNVQTILLGWHDFYPITGAVAASLVVLLFVGLSLHLGSGGTSSGWALLRVF